MSIALHIYNSMQSRENVVRAIAKKGKTVAGDIFKESHVIMQYYHDIYAPRSLLTCGR